MKRHHLYLSTLCAAALLTGCSSDKVEEETLWGIYQEPIVAEELPDTGDADEAEVVWKRKIGSGPHSGFARLLPGITDNSLFVADREGDVYRLDAGSGEIVWRARLDESINAAVGVGEGTVVVGHDSGNVTALSAQDGSMLWVSGIKRQISAPPVVGRAKAVIRTSDGLIIGLDLDSGETAWRISKKTPGLTVKGDSTPVIYGNVLLIGLSSGKLIANNVVSGRAYWEAEITHPGGRNEIERLSDSDAPPLVQGETVYAASYQGNIVAFHLEGAQVLWRTNFSTRLPMFLSNGQLFLTGQLGEVAALNAETGEMVWQQEIFRGHGVSAPVVAGGWVVIGDASGRIHVLDRDTGALVQTLKVVSDAVLGIIENKGSVTVTSAEGDISTIAFKNR